MRTLFIPLAVILVFIPLTGNSQQAAAPAGSPQTPAANAITPGTLIQAEIMTDVDANKAQPGDVFRVRIWADIRSDGKVVLPQKTILLGHVVAAKRNTKDNPQSALTIAFDKALLKNGDEFLLRAIVERVQLSPMAASAAANANRSYNSGLNPGSTTNIAMPASGDSGPGIDLTSGPSNVRDASIQLLPNNSAGITVLTSTTKSGVKLKRLATLDLRVVHSGS